MIVVDDGSTDDSLELLNEKYGRHPTVRILNKQNEGQLSCFNEGFARAKGDIIFFLDSDDTYEPDYLERALSVYQHDQECDFLSCGRRLFGDKEGVLLDFSVDRDLGYSVIQAAYLHQWIGAATSCLSMRRHVLSKVLPLPFIEDWRIRADDCLVFGSSLAGVRKRYLARPLVKYRVHGRNSYRGQATNQSSIYRRRLAINRLFEHFERKLCYSVPQLAEFYHREFCTIEAPTLSEFGRYFRIGMAARISPLRRLACTTAMFRHFVRAARRKKERLRALERATAEGPRVSPLVESARDDSIRPLSTSYQLSKSHAA